MSAGSDFTKAFLADIELEHAAERALLAQAAAMLDEIEILETSLAERGPIRRGSKEQDVVAPEFGAIRSHRVAFSRLVAQLVPPPDPMELLKKQRAQRLAAKRWSPPVVANG